MSTLQEYYEIAGSNRGDPLMLLVHQFQVLDANILRLKRRTAEYLIPIVTETGLVPAFDESRRDEIIQIADDIKTKTVERDVIQSKINRIDNLLSNNNLELPLLDNIIQKLAGYRYSIDRLDQKVKDLQAALLRGGERMTRREAHERDLTELQQSLADLKAKNEPEIERLSQVVNEITAIIQA